jgi:hypothetical protein
VEIVELPEGNARVESRKRRNPNVLRMRNVKIAPLKCHPLSL